MRNISRCLSLGVAFVWLSGGVALAQGDPCRGCDPSAQDGNPWCETFESYEVGEQPPVNGWLGPFTVTNEQNNTPGGDQSMAVDTNDDYVRCFDGSDLAHSDYWFLKTFVYIPSEMEGNAYWIVYNDSSECGDLSTNWAIQMRMNAQNGLAVDDIGGNQLPLITDEWVELRAEIQLAADKVRIFYGGDFLTQYAWTANGGSLRIRAIDLFNDNATRWYADDLSLCPVVIPGETPVPAASDWSLVFMALLVLTAGVIVAARKRAGIGNPAP